MKKLSNIKRVSLYLSMFALVAIAAPSLALADCPGDIDGSGYVGFSDLTQVLANWGECPGCAADLDGSGYVGFSDLTQVLAGWGECPAPGCIYHDDCAPDEYCAGEGCQEDGDWYGPLPEGVCTPKLDPASCAGEPVNPVCACNNQLRLSECELQVYGERYRLDGFCPQAQCPSGLDSDCPPNHHCADGGGTVPNICLPNP